MLEEMHLFFEKRLEGYEKHMLTCIESAEEFYPYTASLLPMEADCRVLDLGCGTGLELSYYFDRNPQARVTGIDLSEKMLAELLKKFPEKSLELIRGSYFEILFGKECFHAAVSVESLHHFTKEEKIPLYRRLHESLVKDGYFILTDYFAASDEEEEEHRAALARLKREQGLSDQVHYHYDTPLTVAHEIEALTAGGFSEIEILGSWANTYTLRARK